MEELAELVAFGGGGGGDGSGGVNRGGEFGEKVLLHEREVVFVDVETENVDGDAHEGDGANAVAEEDVFAG